MLVSRDYMLTGGAYSGLFAQLRAAALLSVFVDRGVLQQADRALGTLGVAAGNPVIGYDGDLGMVIDFDGTGDRLAYSGHPWAANSDATFAFIGKFDSFAANDSFLTTRGAVNQGLVFGQISTGTGELRLTKGGVVSTDSGIVPVTGVPYFCAVSYRHSTGEHRFVARRLDTGALSTGSATESSAYSAGDGTFTVGGDQNFATDSDMKIAAAYISNRCFDSDDLQRWARDPFGVWIEPNPLDPALYVAPAGGAFFSRYYYDMARAA